MQHVTLGSVGLSGALAWSGSMADLEAAALLQAGATWDVSWAEKLKAKHKAVMDCVEAESGIGVWRAGAWASQVADVFKAPPSDITAVIVLRHEAIALAMSQAFWDKYAVNADKKITHPLTEQPTDKNPILLDERDGIPAPFNNMSLPKQQNRGAVVLACNLALRSMVGLVQKADSVSEDEAHKRAVAGLIPGVILQPSGVFAAVRGQQAGCAYVRVS